MEFIMWEFLFCGDYINSRYRWSVRRAKRLSDKLANPINQRTGKPLSPVTLRRYRRERDKWAQEKSLLKQAIAILSQCRLIGPKSDEDCPDDNRFLRSVIECLAETSKANETLQSKVSEKSASLDRWKKEAIWWMEQSVWWMERCDKQFGHGPSKKRMRFELIQGGKHGARRSIPRGPFSQRSE
jgi:hypothetical protein